VTEKDETKAPNTTPALIAIDATWPSVRVIVRVVVVILLVLGAIWVVLKLTTILLLLVLGVFFAYLVSPLVEIVRRPRFILGRQIAVPLPIAIAISYLLILAVVFLGIYFVIPQVTSQYPQFALQLQDYSQTLSAKTKGFTEYLRQHGVPDSALRRIGDEVPGLLGKMQEVAGVIVAKLAEWVVFVPWVVLVPILSFFMLKDAESFRRSALHMLPRGRWRWRGDELFQDINSTLAAYTRAQLTACFLIGATCALGFTFLGLPSPLVLGLIAGLFEFVPLVGPLSLAVLAAVVAVLHSGFSTALVVLIFLGVLRIFQDYLIYPRLIGHGIHLHPLAVIIAILCGAELAGVAGIFLAIPVVALVTVFYRHWLEHRGSEGLADLLEDEVEAAAEDLAEILPADDAMGLSLDDAEELNSAPSADETRR
jgi:predicted PurR-regulated permease PerM